jgi:FAD/FMN-containing dehydrogenase/Fe-S oxidoreductase
MSTTLPVLRERVERTRFARERVDDSRTAIPSDAARELAGELKRSIAGEVRFDKGTRALYATDSSNFRQTPIGVVIPRHDQDVEITLAAARKFGAPVLARGCGTSLAGQCCNVAVVMDFSKYMNRILDIDPKHRRATVQPGVVLDDLRGRAINKYKLNFAPDPETQTPRCPGGMLGNNSCGVHSLMAKNNGMGLRCSDNTHSMEIITYDGLRLNVGETSPEELENIIRAGGQRGALYQQLKNFRDKYADAIRTKMPKLGRRVSGYNIDDLLPENGFNVARAVVGSESTLVTILQATLLLVPEPKARTLLILGYPDIYSAADHLEEILPFNPTGLEGMDHLLFKYVKDKGDENANLALLPPGGGYLLVEFGGDSKKDSDDQARRLMDLLKGKPNPPSMKLYDDPQQEEMIWKVREGSLGSTAWVPGLPDTWEGWEDSAVPVHNVAKYLRELRKLLDKYHYEASLYGHLGQGCIHTRIPFDLYTAEGIKQWVSFMDEATSLCVSMGGSLSGEHGDGQSRGQWLPKMFGPELMEAFHEFKRIWDPQWKMNPGKIISPYAMTDNLRIGPDYNPPQPQTYFNSPADRHSFARASLRCVGVGECRRHGGGTMCPSYMVTREEKHSTRGRARMLFEMMNGEILEDGWKSDAVKESLDLCLSCKGCKGDCPVNVDMATYKAEFLAHYYEGRLRPRHAYAFGWIHLWSVLAGYAPMIANFFTQTPGLRSISKWLAGMDQRRSIPAFAPQPFKEWFASHRPKNPHGSPVILWPDTFNNFYHPDTAIAAVEVLEDAGFKVDVPMQDVCCGRPLYDYGFLNMARKWLEDILHKLQREIESGTPIVVLEPSCWAVFKDELTNILPQREDAKRLQMQVYTLSDFLDKQAPNYRYPRLQAKALLHGHCHQKALDRLNDKRYGELFAEKDVLKKMGVEHDFLQDAGCCGMAGAFGFEEGEHYKVAMAAGERSLLPDVRNASDQTLIIADGFSCREQIEQGTGRQALHLAQVMRLAQEHGGRLPNGRPERELVRKKRRAMQLAAVKTGAVVGAGAIVGGMIYSSLKSRSRGRQLSSRMER